MVSQYVLDEEHSHTPAGEQYKPMLALHMYVAEQVPFIDFLSVHCVLFQYWEMSQSHLFTPYVVGHEQPVPLPTEQTRPIV